MSQFRDFSEIEIPTIVYKYRDWEDDYHKRIITHREIYFPSPERFDDKFDCRIPIRYDLLRHRDMVLKVKSERPDWTHKQQKQFIRRWFQGKQESAMGEQELFQEEFFSRFGVLSLTEIPDNDLMWHAYSNNSRGFCIGFNSEIMFNYLGGGGNVSYHNELPIVYPRPKHSFEEQHNLQIYSKLREYEYEKEYRTHIFSKTTLTNEERTRILPADAYSEIIFGNNMPEEMQEELLESIPNELGHIKLIN